MTIATAVTLLLAGVVILSVAILLDRLAQYRRELAGESDFNPSRYAPMGRLLDPSEVAFLAAQPGTTAQELREFRTSRRRIFRMYLRDLTRDFMALHAEARELVAASPDRNPELVEMLLRQQVQFWMSVAGLEASLALDAVGLGSVDPRRLLETVESLHIAVVRATSVPGPVPVA